MMHLIREIGLSVMSLDPTLLKNGRKTPDFNQGI